MGDSGPTGKFKLETSNILNKKYSMKCSKKWTHNSQQITPGGHYSKCETKWKLDSCGLSLPGRANNLKEKCPFLKACQCVLKLLPWVEATLGTLKRRAHAYGFKLYGFFGATLIKSWWFLFDWLDTSNFKSESKQLSSFN
jgi:hypothetical protein